MSVIVRPYRRGLWEVCARRPSTPAVVRAVAVGRARENALREQKPKSVNNILTVLNTMVKKARECRSRCDSAPGSKIARTPWRHCGDGPVRGRESRWIEELKWCGR